MSIYDDSPKQQFVRSHEAKTPWPNKPASQVQKLVFQGPKSTGTRHQHSKQLVACRACREHAVKPVPCSTQALKTRKPNQCHRHQDFFLCSRAINSLTAE